MKKTSVFIKIMLVLLLEVLFTQCNNSCNRWICVPEENMEISLEFQSNSSFVDVKTDPDPLSSNYANVYLFTNGTRLKRSNDTLYYWENNQQIPAGFIIKEESDSQMKLFSFGLFFPDVNFYVLDYLFVRDN